MGTQNFNFVPKFFKNGGFSVPDFVYLEETFPTGYNLSPATTPLSLFRGRWQYSVYYVLEYLHQLLSIQLDQ